jgi:hypothetical protein
VSGLDYKESINRVLKNSLLTRARTARRKAQAIKAKFFAKLAKFTFANLG